MLMEKSLGIYPHKKNTYLHENLQYTDFFVYLCRPILTIKYKDKLWNSLSLNKISTKF